MTKSILKHKIQTLTGKNIKQLEEAMGYKVILKLLLDIYNIVSPQPKNPDEMTMDIDTMKKLASSLILQAEGDLPDYPEGEEKVHLIVDVLVN